ncbi:hypothetical protein M501DRAFT_917658, partial [Patellaria atrata CBS 101060]
APFSGAIYIVNSDGTSWSSLYPAMCPVNAAISCNGIGHPNWCCPSTYACAISSNSLVGCCPNGSICQGNVNAAAISTVTVTQFITPTPTQVTVAQQPPPANGQYCSTLTARGPGLPTTALGECGTILVVNRAERLTGTVFWGFGVMAVGSGILIFHVAIARFMGG